MALLLLIEQNTTKRRWSEHSLKLDVYVGSKKILAT